MPKSKKPTARISDPDPNPESADYKAWHLQNWLHCMRDRLKASGFPEKERRVLEKEISALWNTFDRIGRPAHRPKDFIFSAGITLEELELEMESCFFLAGQMIQWHRKLKAEGLSHKTAVEKTIKGFFRELRFEPKATIDFLKTTTERNWKRRDVLPAHIFSRRYGKTSK